MKKIVSIMMLLMLSVAPLSFAGFDESSWTETEGYWEQSLAKLEFGVLNTLGGWTEVYYETDAAKQNDENCLVGFGKGLTKGIVNTALGALHVVTFPIPVDVPLVDGGVQID